MLLHDLKGKMGDPLTGDRNQIIIIMTGVGCHLLAVYLHLCGSQLVGHAGAPPRSGRPIISRPIIWNARVSTLFVSLTTNRSPFTKRWDPPPLNSFLMHPQRLCSFVLVKNNSTTSNSNDIRYLVIIITPIVLFLSVWLVKLVN